jgi:glycosyltransferase involved in cell wall biosynthesis
MPPADFQEFQMQAWKTGGRIVRWLQEHRAAAAIVQGYSDVGMLRVISWCAKHNVPCLLSGDSNILADRSSGMRRWLKTRLLHWLVKKSGAILPFGSNGRAYFARYGASQNRIFNFPMEPDYELILQLPREEIDKIGRRFGLDSSRRRLVFSGRLAEVKRVDLLLDAFAAIADARPLWDLVIVGDGPLRDELHRRVPESIRTRVTWTGFVAEQTTIAGIYRASDVLVLPSQHEPWALVVNEAAAAGLAIVASDVVGAVADLVVDHVNGRIFPSRDLAKLTECLLDVTDPDHIDAMKAASHDVIARWRRESDPVEGLRKALRSLKVLPAQ